MDPEQLKLGVEAMDQLVNVAQSKGQRVRDLFFGEIIEGTEEFKDKLKDVKRENEKVADAFADAWQDKTETVIRAAEKMKGAIKKNITEAVKGSIAEFQRLNREIGKTQTQAIKGVRKNLRGRVAGRDEMGGATEGLNKLISTVFSQVPFGGILGIMFFGRFREEHWDSVAQKTIQQFEQVGSAGQRSVGALAANIRNLERTIPGIASAFDASAASLAGFGYTADDAMERISMDIEGARDDVITLATTMDRHFELAAGTAGEAMAQLAAITGSTLEEAGMKLARMGAAARNAGVNMRDLVAAVMQTTSAMRLQLSEMEVMDTLSRRMAQVQGALVDQGMSKQLAGKITTQAFGQLGSFISNLSMEWKAVIGERMGALSGRRVRGGAAIRGFEQGLEGTDDQLGLAMRAILDVIKQEGGPTRENQYLFMRRGLNMSPEMTRIFEAMEGDISEGMATDKAIEKYMKEMKKALGREAEKTSVFERMAKTAIDLLAQLGTSIIDALSAGFEMLVSTMAYYGKYMTVGVTPEETGAYQALTGHLVGVIRKTPGELAAQLDTAMDTGGRFANAVAGRSAETQHYASHFWRGYPQVGATPDRRNMVDDVVDAIAPHSYFLSGSGKRPAGRPVRPPPYTEIELDVPPGGGKAKGKLRPVNPPTREPGTTGGVTGGWSTGGTTGGW